MLVLGGNLAGMTLGDWALPAMVLQMFVLRSCERYMEAQETGKAFCGGLRQLKGKVQGGISAAGRVGGSGMLARRYEHTKALQLSHEGLVILLGQQIHSLTWLFQSSYVHRPCSCELHMDFTQWSWDRLVSEQENRNPEKVREEASSGTRFLSSSAVE